VLQLSRSCDKTRSEQVLEAQSWKKFSFSKRMHTQEAPEWKINIMAVAYYHFDLTCTKNSTFMYAIISTSQSITNPRRKRSSEHQSVGYLYDLTRKHIEVLAIASTGILGTPSSINLSPFRRMFSRVRGPTSSEQVADPSTGCCEVEVYFQYRGDF
jgi:hypothetical protein